MTLPDATIPQPAATKSGANYLTQGAYDPASSSR